MAGTVRSSLLSRLRQLLSGEGSIGPNVKLDSETPPKVKAFIDKVILCPLQDIAIPLSGFSWEYNKGNFHHWRPLFLHFDTYFKTYLSARKDLLLTDNIIEDDSPFPKQSVLQILRVMRIILENCHNKGSFSGLEHFKLLLASTDPEDNSLSLLPSDLPSDNGNSQNHVGSTLYFELHGTDTIHIPDLHMWKEDDLSIMKLLVEKYNVPVDHRFLLLTRVRYAHAFRSLRICKLYSKICLLAFIVLVQSSDSHDELMSFFANEPEYTNELIRLVKSEETISPTIRTLAMHALGS
ncbi:unnamed protein product [Lactuca saligna]|uniref:DUF908 domain-containing protein n=1 Tax=Lactuca saligna TaxID=75948 RepID=A0AA35ZGG1_LACSI|nr:unnamed protein product [Lactuca saligna]